MLNENVKMKFDPQHLELNIEVDLNESHGSAESGKYIGVAKATNLQILDSDGWYLNMTVLKVPLQQDNGRILIHHSAEVLRFQVNMRPGPHPLWNETGTIETLVSTNGLKDLPGYSGVKYSLQIYRPISQQPKAA